MRTTLAPNGYGAFVSLFLLNPLVGHAVIHFPQPKHNDISTPTIVPWISDEESSTNFQTECPSCCPISLHVSRNVLSIGTTISQTGSLLETVEPRYT